ncbi:MAG: hypothetical protein HeimC2_11080 [Candidatus Heimdallarchaeota archaeon LC_2]|nr:MAG: hypothetical protein HeimC2_11080 [Candidatus Heimdallarchaeota archaeon LC_2]
MKILFVTNETKNYHSNWDKNKMPSCDNIRELQSVKDLLTKYDRQSGFAKDLYKGNSWNSVLKVKELSKNIDIKIISSMFGLIDFEKRIIPYNCLFSNFQSSELVKRAKTLQIENSLVELLKKSQKYDLIYISLGSKYLQTIGEINQYLDYTDELVVFKPYTKIEGNLIQLKSNDFVGNLSINVSTPIGPLMTATNNIFLNFIQYYSEHGIIDFIDWLDIIHFDVNRD